MTLLTNV